MNTNGYQTKEFTKLNEAVGWFKNKGYTWYTNTLEDPEKAVKGLLESLKLNDKNKKNKSGNLDVIVGTYKETNLIYYKY